MLVFPKTLLPFWSDYCPAVIDVEAIIAAHIDENPSVRNLDVELRSIHDYGAQSEWTLRHIGQATAQLCAWCVRNGRYFSNIAIEQKVEGDDLALARLPMIPDLPWWRSWPWRGEKQGVPGQSAPFAASSLRQSDLVLIDAPICMNSEANSHSAYLCDVPPFARKVDDARLQLILSETVRRKLAEYLSNATDWMPFCRTLGIVRNRPQGQVVEVLQISARISRFPDAGWAMRLINEADEMQFYKSYRDDDDIFLKDWVAAYRSIVEQERAKHADVDDTTFGERCGPDLASTIFRFDEYSARYYIKRENNPYSDAEGFWCSLATILPGWRDNFALTQAEVNALLRKFDATYDDSWKTSMSDLVASGLFRFSPAVMDKIRARIASLAGFGAQRDTTPPARQPPSSPTERDPTSAASA